MVRRHIETLGLVVALTTAAVPTAMAEPGAPSPPVLPATPDAAEPDTTSPHEGEPAEDPPETPTSETPDDARSTSVPEGEGGDGATPPSEPIPPVDAPSSEFVGEPPVETLTDSPKPHEIENEPVDEPIDEFGDDLDEEPWPDDEPASPAPDYDPMRDSPQAVQARHWVRTGIVTLSAGGALLLGAVLMGTSDPCNLAIGNSCQPTARNRAALVMGLPALALIGGGAAALTIGMQRRKALMVDLQAGRGRVGLGLRGRF